MENKILLEAKKRDVFGRKVKRLRKEGFIPANIYGRNVKSLAIAVDEREFEKVFKEAGETQIINLKLGNEQKPVLIHNTQKDPLTGKIIHIDFLQVDLHQKVTASIPVVGVGESPVEKQGLGTVVFYINEIEVEALPMDLPERVEVDLSVLGEVGQSILVKDLNFDKEKVEVKDNPDEVVVKVEPIKEEVLEESPTPALEAEVSETLSQESQGQEVEGQDSQETAS
ncbi:MAG: 50S ribosomal protein L25 [Patescibacteria group bacterium]|nr:MAG: 50S ribosomal protein L25 [Patescibacteria group bacterium]